MSDQRRPRAFPHESPAPTSARALSRTAAVLPALYAAWMDELLGSSIPPETEATCHDCAMCPGGADGARAAAFFDPSVKCCTYLPELPSFLVGAILHDDAVGVSGRATVEARVRARAAVLPLGLGRPATYDRLYDLRAKAAGFGRDRALRCPHFLGEGGGTCGIWRHRNAICATWFCKRDRGAVGLIFWRTLQQLLSTVEHDLAWWCVQQLDIGTAAYDAIVGYTVRRQQGQHEEEIEEAARRTFWGAWAGREEAFYRASAERVAALSWPEVSAVCGPRVRQLARRTRRAFARLTSPRVSDRLRTNTFEAVRVSSTRTRVRAYSSLDPLDLPTPLARALRHFDGRPTGQALSRIRRQDGLEIDDDVLRQLVDFGILVGCRRETGSTKRKLA